MRVRDDLGRKAEEASYFVEAAFVSTQVCVVAPGVQGAAATAGRWYDPGFVSVSPGAGEGSPTGSFGK